MTADIEATATGVDSRMAVIADKLEELWADLDASPSIEAEAAGVIEALDAHDTDQGVVRVNLLKQRAIEAERDRLRGVVHAMLQAFEHGESETDPMEGPAAAPHVRSIWVPESMFEGWRLAAEGGH